MFEVKTRSETIIVSKRYVIGVDPGKTTGLAVYDRQASTLTRLESTDFWGAVDFITSKYPLENVHLVIVELPRTRTVWHKTKDKRGVHTKVGADVGGVIREAELLADRLRQLGYNVKTVHPLGKVDARLFKKITAWEGRTNQHVRDAGIMTWGY